MIDKPEILSPKLETNPKLETHGNKQAPRYDLEERTMHFAKDMRLFVRSLTRDTANNEDIKQIVRSSGSVGANYLEANESLSKKDFLMRIKISKKECRETIWWLELLDIKDSQQAEQVRLTREATEIMNILGAILRNSTK
jgi:four helix bundle protein